MDATVTHKIFNLQKQITMFTINNIPTDIKTVSEFAHSYFKAERFTARGKDYVNSLISSLERDMESFGYCAVSKYSSILNEYTVLKLI